MDEEKLQEMIDKAIAKSVVRKKEKSDAEKRDAKVEAKVVAEDAVKGLVNVMKEHLKEEKGGTDKDAEKQTEKLFNTEDGLRGIKYPEMSELKDLSDDDKIAVFFKALVLKDGDIGSERVFKALTEGVAADGGNLVPTPLANRLWEILPDMAIMRQLADTITMTSQTLKLSARTTNPKAYWIGEKQSKTTTSAEISRKTLTCNKLVCRIAATDELIADANIDLVNSIIEWFARAIATEEDNAFFTGTGTGQPRGISIETLSSQSAGASIDFDDMVDLVDLPPQWVKRNRNAAFVANSEAIRLLRKVKDGNNNYIWAMGTQGVTGGTDRPADRVMGYPIYEQNDLSGNEIYFGDWSKYIIGDRQQITVATSKEAANAWRDDLTEIKAVERVDGRAVMTQAFAKLTNV